MLKVLGRLSSINVRKVLWTCDEVGIPFEREDWGIGFKSPQLPEFLALNPNAKVPVICEDHYQKIIPDIRRFQIIDQPSHRLVRIHSRVYEIIRTVGDLEIIRYGHIERLMTAESEKCGHEWRLHPQYI